MTNLLYFVHLETNTKNNIAYTLDILKYHNNTYFLKISEHNILMIIQKTNDSIFMDSI